MNWNRKNTIKSHKKTGGFFLNMPKISDMRGWDDDHSITSFRVEGKAYYRMDKEMERKSGATDSRWIVGEFSVPDEIVYTVLKPSVSESYTDTSKFSLTPYGGSFQTPSYDDQELEHRIAFKLQFHCTRTDTVYDVEGGSRTTENSYDDEGTFNMGTVGFSDPYPVEESDSTQSVGVTGKWEFYKPPDRQWGFPIIWQKEPEMPSAGLHYHQHFAILLSILFGNTGGFIPTVPAGQVAHQLPHLMLAVRAVGCADDDGDIEATDL